jgi:ATP-binding cassette, subfamily C, bacterial CydC
MNLNRRPAASAGFGLALTAVAEACGIGLLGLSGWFIAACAVAGTVAVSAFSYLPPSGGVQAFALGRIASTYASRVVLHAAALRRITMARLRFYDRAAADPGAWSGDSLDRALADTDTAGMALIQATAPRVAAAAVTAGGCVAVVLSGYPTAALILAVAATSCALLAPRTASDDGGAARAELRTGLVAAVEARSEMASLGATGRLEQRTFAALAAFETDRLRGAVMSARGTGLARAITTAALALAIVSAARDGAPVAFVVFLGLLTVGVMTCVERLVPAAQAERSARSARERIEAVNADPPRPLGLRVSLEGGELAASDYRLPATPARTGRLLEFRAKAGGTVLVTGVSGSGKTTLLTAIDEALRDRADATVAFVRADDYTFTGTVADNLRLADPAADDARIAALLADMRLIAAPDTRLGFGGRAFSGGEERRLHIARALAMQPDVLIIDEPTAGLDDATATHVLQAIRGRLPHAVLVLAMHEAAPKLLSEDALTVPLDQ